MPKGYWIAHVDVRDPEIYQQYVKANAKPFAKYGARFQVRSGRSAQKEGALRSRHVVIEFKDYATALACYDSSERRSAFALRRPPVSQGDLVIIEGYDGKQPA